MKRELVLYIDGTDWQHELGEADDGTVFYPSLGSIKRHSGCWDECGIVRVKATFSGAKWLHKGEFGYKERNDDEQRANMIKAYEAKIAFKEGQIDRLRQRVEHLKNGGEL